MGAIVHLSGWFAAILLSIFWWRAWKHLLDGGDPFAKGWMESGSWAFGWINGLWSFGGHLVSDPMRLGQLIAVGVIIYLTQDRTAEPSKVELQQAKPSGWATIAIIWLITTK